MKKQSEKLHEKSQKISLPDTADSGISRAKSQIPSEIVNIIADDPNLPPELKKFIKEDIKNLPEAEQKKLIASFSFQQVSSPFPPPAVLEGLEKVCPGAASSIMDMVVKAQAKKLDIADANIRKSDNEGSILKTESETGNTIALAQIYSKRS